MKRRFQVHQIPGVTRFQIDNLGKTVTGLSGIVPFVKPLAGGISRIVRPANLRRLGR